MGVALLSSCQWFGGNESEDALARVGDRYLFLEDVEGLATANSDSAQIVKNYIDNWVKEQLLLRKALQNLPDDQVNFEKQLDNEHEVAMGFTGGDAGVVRIEGGPFPALRLGEERLQSVFVDAAHCRLMGFEFGGTSHIVRCSVAHESRDCQLLL